MEIKCDNKRNCPCTYDCPRHGKCCACVAHHRDHNEGVPGCFFSKEAEATYDRSIKALAKDHGIIYRAEQRVSQRVSKDKIA